jgi:hypothetical protein
MIMVVLFFLFQFSGVVKETWNDYETNKYAQSSTEHTTENTPVTDQTTGVKSGRFVVYIGGGNQDDYQAVVNQWGTYTKRYIETYNSLKDYEAKVSDTPEVILIDPDHIDWEKDTPLLENFVKNGGNLIFCNLPDASVIKQNDELRTLLGIENVKSDRTTVSGIHLFAGLLLGGEDQYIAKTDEDTKENQDLTLELPWYQVSSGTKAYMVGMLDDKKVKNEELPAIIWRNSIGAARIFAVNGNYLKDNTGIGILDGMMYEMKDYDLYPVVNAQSMVVTNYPVVTAENETEMQKRYSRSLNAVARDIIWPGIAAVCSNTDMKLTSMMTPQLDYADKNEPDAKELVYYMKLLREQNAEIGISATNRSGTDITTKLKQDETFLNSKVPDYSYLSFYQDQLTKQETTQALGENLLKKVRTLYTDYHATDTLLSYETKDITKQSATIDGFSHTYSEDLRLKSLETALGYSSILVNMERVLYPKDDSDSWEKLYNKYASNTSTYWKPFRAFAKTTLSESDSRTRKFLGMNYTQDRQKDEITLDSTGFDTTASYILRTHGEDIASIEGATYTQLEEGAYLIEANSSKVKIKLTTINKPFYHDR